MWIQKWINMINIINILVVTKYTLRISILLFFAYSYISFFDKWNWYIMYILNIVEKSN